MWLQYVGSFICGMQTLRCGRLHLVPGLGIEPWPPILGAQSLSPWTTREVPNLILYDAWIALLSEKPTNQRYKRRWRKVIKTSLVFPAPSAYHELLGEWVNEVAQSCPTLCDPLDCSLPGSSVHEIFQARILEWVAISFCRRSSQPRDWTWVSHIVGRRFTVWATREVFSS